jgi:hypothetical protein
MEKATAYLSKLEADRLAATAMSKEKAREAMLIEARDEGFRFREAMEIFGANVTTHTPPRTTIMSRSSYTSKSNLIKLQEYVRQNRLKNCVL